MLSISEVTDIFYLSDKPIYDFELFSPCHIFDYKKKNADSPTI